MFWEHHGFDPLCLPTQENAMINLTSALGRNELVARSLRSIAFPLIKDAQSMRACPSTRNCQQNFACTSAGKKVLPIKPSEDLNQHGFDTMVDAFRNSGGTARADDFALLLEEKQKGNFVSLAKRLVSRDIFSFEYQDHFWIPMFQFHVADLSGRQEVSRVVNELAAVLDSLMLAIWFTEPNEWLQCRRPVDMMDHYFSDVLAAARADRFVAKG